MSQYGVSLAASRVERVTPAGGVAESRWCGLERAQLHDRPKETETRAKLRTWLLLQYPAGRGAFRRAGAAEEEKCEYQAFVTFLRWIRWALADDRCFVREAKLQIRLLWQDAGGQRDFGIVRAGEGRKKRVTKDPMTARK